MFTTHEEVQDFFHAFLRDWLCWALTDVRISGASYTGRQGLCAALTSFMHNAEIYGAYNKQAIRVEMYKRFTANGLDIDYPFGRGAFRMYMDAGRLHKDPTRINWVKSQLPQFHLDYVEKFLDENIKVTDLG